MNEQEEEKLREEENTIDYQETEVDGELVYEEPTKVCKTCKKDLPLSAYRKTNKNTDNRNKNCNECIAQNPVYQKIAEQTAKDQEKFLEALSRSANNISVAVKQTGISRQTHLNWVENFEDYKNRYEEISETVIDWVEGKMMSLIKKEDKTMIIFYLKTRAKHRGYIERVDNYNLNLNKDVDEDDLDRMSLRDLQAYRKQLEEEIGVLPQNAAEAK